MAEERKSSSNPFPSFSHLSFNNNNNDNNDLLNQTAPFFDIHGIINLGQVSKLFQQLITHIENQNKKISVLEHEISQRVTIKDFVNHVQKMETNIQKIESKLQQVEIAATSIINNRKVTAGELAASNYYFLQKLNKTVSNCIQKEEFQEHTVAINLLQKDHVKFTKELQSLLEILTLIQKEQVEHEDRLNLYDHTIQQKLDKSELSQLQSMMKIILLYDDFRKQTEENLVELNQFQKQTTVNIDELQKDLQKSFKKIEEMQNELPRFALKRDIHIVAKELKEQSQRIDKCASISSVDEVRDHLTKLHEALSKTQVYANVLNDEIAKTQEELLTKASIEDVELRLPAIEFQQHQRRIEEILKTKTSVVISESLQLQLKALEERLNTESQRIDISIKFVEWFSGRGENYEHNLQIIDKHLKDLLSSTKVPRVHSYYLPNNQVEFRPIQKEQKLSDTPIYER